MDEHIRLQYLEAMGIDVWLPRAQAAMQNRDDNLPENEISEALPAPHLPALQPVVSSPSFTASSNDNTETWEALQQKVIACQACALCQTRTQTVFGVGKRSADWLLIGEAPGHSEDQQGEPFVGIAGQLLNEMLFAIGLKREDVYIANMLKCRPPNNRDPQVEEIEACRWFLQSQIALLQPKVILAVGRIAAQNLLNQTIPLSRLRGQQHQLLGIPLFVVHHPAYLLRSPMEKRKAWEDLQFAVAGYQRLLTLDIAGNV